jgi:hypothetical protein
VSHQDPEQQTPTTRIAWLLAMADVQLAGFQTAEKYETAAQMLTEAAHLIQYEAEKLRRQARRHSG